MMKKLIVIILCVCMLFNFAAQPVHAMGAEGIIIGGAAAAGVTLTVGQVALIAAAAFGLVYAATHADELGAMLESALSAAVSNDETREQQLTKWKTRACSGLIALATAPAWIKGVINNWVTQQHEAASVPKPVISPVMEYPAGTEIPPINFYLEGSEPLVYQAPVTVVRSGKCEYKQVGSQWVYDIAASMLIISTSYKAPYTKIFTHNGTSYYVQHVTSGTSIPDNGNDLAGDNKKAWDAISSLPNHSDIYDKYEYKTTIETFFRAWADGYFTPTEDSVCPDVTVGGVGNALKDHSIDNINIPDINVGQSDLLVPDNTASINDTLNDVLTRLEQQDLTWQQYMDDVAVGTPSVSVPAEGTQTGTLEYPLTDTGVSDVPMDTTQPDNPSTSIPEGIEPYTLDLRTFFPFCIPFDIVKFVDTLCAEPEAPRFTWGIATPDGGTEEMDVDLALFDPVAEILRGMELLLFIIGLAFLTRALIRG